jgi:hypothetical protein
MPISPYKMHAGKHHLQTTNRDHLSMPACSAQTPTVSVCIRVHLWFNSGLQALDPYRNSRRGEDLFATETAASVAALERRESVAAACHGITY